MYIARLLLNVDYIKNILKKTYTCIYLYIRNLTSVFHFNAAMAIIGWKTLLLAGVALAMALFINCPSPQMSDGLQEWKARGKHFTYKDWQIFYQGKF